MRLHQVLLILIFEKRREGLLENVHFLFFEEKQIHPRSSIELNPRLFEKEKALILRP